MSVMTPESFYLLTRRDVVEQTIAETAVAYDVDLGNGLVLYFGMREGSSVWILDNPAGISPVWYDDAA